MVNVETSKLLCHVNGYVVTGHQVFMLNFILPASLVDDEL